MSAFHHERHSLIEVYYSIACCNFVQSKLQLQCCDMTASGVSEESRRAAKARAYVEHPTARIELKTSGGILDKFRPPVMPLVKRE